MVALGGAGGRSKKHYFDRTMGFGLLVLRICCWTPKGNRILPVGFGPNPILKNTRPTSGSKPYGNHGDFNQTMVSPK